MWVVWAAGVPSFTLATLLVDGVHAPETLLWVVGALWIAAFALTAALEALDR